MRRKSTLFVKAVLCFLLLLHSSSGSIIDLTFDAGYITVDKTYDANLFYYFVESQNEPSKDPVFLWLQGGPGCSSLFGAFIENGPQIIQTDGSFKDNIWSWTSNASVLWIDSPVGTGFSYVSDLDYATDEKTIANDLHTALVSFFYQLHPEYSKNDFYIFGESYAGKYVPWLAYTILQQNSSSNIINLKGVGIGNGWVNPYYQTGSYGPFLFRHNLINTVELDAADALYETYKGLIDIGAYIPATDAGNLLLETLVVEAGVGDVYDIRKPSDPTDPLSNLLQTYLNKPETRKMLNVGDHQWEACATAPQLALASDEERSAEYLVPAILAEIPVMLYNGDMDLICNMDGTATWSSLLEWPYKDQFNNAPNVTWSIPDGSNQVAGFFKSYNNLAKVVVNGAGHMVPYDQPKAAHYLVYGFINGAFKPQ